ncbi:MAG: hypothetical protein AVDCRST_MAG68-4489, partial [uncultured Gemmatimonadetes bacterium]
DRIDRAARDGAAHPRPRGMGRHRPRGNESGGPGGPAVHARGEDPLRGGEPGALSQAGAGAGGGDRVGAGGAGGVAVDERTGQVAPRLRAVRAAYRRHAGGDGARPSALLRRCAGGGGRRRAPHRPPGRGARLQAGQGRPRPARLDGVRGRQRARGHRPRDAGGPCRHEGPLHLRGPGGRPFQPQGRSPRPGADGDGGAARARAGRLDPGLHRRPGGRPPRLHRRPRGPLDGARRPPRLRPAGPRLRRRAGGTEL